MHIFQNKKGEKKDLVLMILSLSLSLSHDKDSLSYAHFYLSKLVSQAISINKSTPKGLSLEKIMF